MCVQAAIWMNDTVRGLFKSLPVREMKIVVKSCIAKTYRICMRMCGKSGAAESHDWRKRACRWQVLGTVNNLIKDESNHGLRN